MFSSGRRQLEAGTDRMEEDARTSDLLCYTNPLLPGSGAKKTRYCDLVQSTKLL